MRHEVTVNPAFVFGSSASGPLSMEPISDPLKIESLSHTFVWHPSRVAPDGVGICCPVVSLLVDGDDADASSEAGLAVNRFIAALSFALDSPIVIGWAMATGFKAQLDQPAACGDDRRSGLMVPTVSTVHVEEHQRIYEVLGLYRDAIATDNPFHHFLSLHNALVAVFDGDDKRADQFVNTKAREVTTDLPLGDRDLADFFRDVLRNAIAHTVRRTGRPTLDPNNPGDRGIAAASSRAIRPVVRSAVGDRWPRGVYTT